MAWMLLWRGVAAAPKLKKLVGDLDGEERKKKILNNKDAAFYEGQLKTAEYFIHSILPVTLGKMEAVRTGNAAIIDMPIPSFGG